MAAAIEVTGVSKRFRLYHEKYQSLKERVIHAGRIPYEDFWALKDIALEIPQGQTLGLIGHNGSGKSTLLKCIAGIVRPTSGEIRTRGRLAAMLELGSGFHPELTGRENVYMNASILGFSEREIDAKFDDIVAFSELEEFIDQQVKHYSSGMYVRLGFAVAVHMDPEILLIDEVLAVGDEAFQLKCLARIREFQNQGRTIVIVTHSADTVPRVCDRAAVLEHGTLVMVGDPVEAVRRFRRDLFDLSGNAPSEGAEASDAHAPDGGPDTGLRILDTRVVFEDPASGYARTGERLTVEVSFVAERLVEDVEFSIAVFDQDGVELFETNSSIQSAPIGSVEGHGEVVVEFPDLALLDGDYTVSVKFTNVGGSVLYGWWQQAASFKVIHPGAERGRVRLSTRMSVELSGSSPAGSSPAAVADAGATE